MTRSTWTGFCLALLAPSLALASDAPPSAPPPPQDFSALWTGWSGLNREAMTVETDAVRRVREDVATADAERLRQLRNQGRALGEQVGEIVRLGDCEEGERVARAAGDFALVEAVLAHCAQTSPAAADPQR
jgi:hypothetical protein